MYLILGNVLNMKLIFANYFYCIINVYKNREGYFNYDETIHIMRTKCESSDNLDVLKRSMEFIHFLNNN